jgi:hypothetical protein
MILAFSDAHMRGFLSWQRRPGWGFGAALAASAPGSKIQQNQSLDQN